MSQKLSDWASIADIGSGIAVVVTLIVLIFGVRANTEVVRASVYESNIQNQNEFLETVLADPDAFRVFVDYVSLNVDASGLDEMDLQRLNIIVLNWFRIFESVYISREYGLLGETEWGRFDGSICIWVERVRSAERYAFLESVMMPEFMEYLVIRCPG